MTTAIPSDTPHPSTRTALPRAVWVGFAALGLVTAALAGALVMKSISPTTPTDDDVPASAMTEVPAAKASNTTSAPQQTARRSTSSSGDSSSTRSQAPWYAPGGTTRTVACSTCGVVESVQAVQQQGQGSGVGVVAGGVAGGLLGNQFGSGKGKTAMTVLGAIGGGFAGNEVEKRVRTETAYDITVRMDDGSARSFRRTQAMAVGAAVVVDGSTLRLSNSNTQRETPSTMRTSSPAGGST
ncbi:MAG: glycine zipper 2TM domain-containing protein [Burkholderiaceae bacterium]|nr:glycine zipper 2TM domain-containing protein [Burkholderiaceae bacterium]